MLRNSGGGWSELDTGNVRFIKAGMKRWRCGKEINVCQNLKSHEVNVDKMAGLEEGMYVMFFMKKHAQQLLISWR